MEAGDYAVTQTEYKGQPAPGAQSLLAFFDVGPGLQLELIQPNEEPSTWREFLDKHGEGVHHLAFNVNGMNMQQAVVNCQDFGMTLEQNACPYSHFFKERENKKEEGKSYADWIIFIIKA